MKSKKIAAIVVAAVLLLGGYSAIRYVENVVVGKIRELERLPSAKISFGEVRFSPLRRHLSLNDVHVEYGNDALRVVYDIRQAEGVLPLGLVRLLFDTPEGMTPILSEATWRDMKISTSGSMTAGMSEATTTVAEQRIINLRADLTEINNLLATSPSESELGLGIAKNTAWDLQKARTIHMELPVLRGIPPIVYDIVEERMEGYGRNRCALIQYSGLNVSKQGHSLAFVQEISIKDFQLPSAFTPRFFKELNLEMDFKKFDPKQEKRAQEAGMKILKTLFAGPEPLFRQIRVQTLKVTPPFIPSISLDALTFDWACASPLKMLFTVENLTLPTQLLTLLAPQISLPGLDMLHLDFTAALDEAADGMERHRETLSLRDVATLATDITVQNRPSLLANVPTSTEHQRNFRLVRAEATLEDKRLLAYVGGNLKPDGVGVTQMMEYIAGDVVAQALEPQKATAVTAQLDSFIQKPGTLKIALTPNQPVLWSLLKDDPRALSDLLNTDLHVEATPGPTPLEQEIRRLFMSDGK